jgi:hypothetical protein
VARINIEDRLWGDIRFQNLMIKTGNRHTAKGMILELYTVAQQFWLPSKGQGIPRPAWDEFELPRELIECRLARDDGDFIYVIGSKEQFAWIEQASASGKAGGKASGEARRENKEESAKAPVPEAKGTLPETNPPSPSLPPSLPPSLFPTLPVSKGSELPSEIKSPIGFFIGRYVLAYQKRYGASARPALGGKTQGEIKRFLEDTPMDRACALIATYCEMSDAWFITKGHDFTTFMSNLTKVGLKLDTGSAPTSMQAKHAEQADFYADQIRRIDEGKL